MSHSAACARTCSHRAASDTNKTWGRWQETSLPSCDTTEQMQGVKECRAAISTHPEGRSCLFQGRSLWTLPHLRARKGESLLIQLKAWEYQINGEKGSFASHSLLWINRATSELISTATAGGRQQQAGGGGSLVWHKEQTIAVTHVHPHFKISEY